MTLSDGRPTIRKIAAVTSRVCGVTTDEVWSRSKRLKVNVARQIVMWVANHEWGYSLSEIGREMDRDHTTVMAAVESVERRLCRGENFVWGILDQISAGVEIPLPPEGEQSRLRESNTVSAATKDDVLKLRKRGMSVDKIARYLDLDEFLVAKICGVQLWKGKPTQEVRAD